MAIILTEREKIGAETGAENTAESGFPAQNSLTTTEYSGTGTGVLVLLLSTRVTEKDQSGRPSPWHFGFQNGQGKLLDISLELPTRSEEGPSWHSVTMNRSAPGSRRG